MHVIFVATDCYGLHAILATSIFNMGINEIFGIAL